ncbi:MAG: class I SAM-dependent methyltransferase [Saprospiraceae bacterium]
MFKKILIPFELDDPRSTLFHREIILNNPFLKRLYKDWYEIFVAGTKHIPGGKNLEIGSGGGFYKEVFPNIITSDILDLPHVDITFSAEQLPFNENELSSIVMLNVFHHIPRPYLFLQEAQRTLIRGGKIIMIEPANSLLGRFIYKRFHHEPFDELGLREIKSGNPMSNSNQALPYIYFKRDIKSFRDDFPSLKINSIQYHSPIKYILSGGVSRTALLPLFMYNPVKFVEWILSPFSKQLGLFNTIEIEKI